MVKKIFKLSETFNEPEINKKIDFMFLNLLLKKLEINKFDCGA